MVEGDVLHVAQVRTEVLHELQHARRRLLPVEIVQDAWCTLTNFQFSLQRDT